MIEKIGTRLGFAKAWLLVTLLGLPLVTPLFRLYVSVCTHDGHLHYHRIAAIYHAWQNGLYFSRWMPDLAFGYGYPFFLYREALPLYLALIPHALGLPLPAAINLFYILCILAAGWFMYLWVRDIFGPTPAVVAAVAYMTAPYQLIDAIIRGNHPESLALPLFPFILWAGRRFALHGSAVPFLLSVFSLLFLALSHNISLLLFTPILFVYLALVSWLNRLDLKTALIRLTLIFGLGLGLAAFYVGPALLELDEITINQSVSNRNNNFRLNFAGLDEILAPVPTADPTLLNQPLFIRIGWVSALLAAAGVGRLLLTTKPKEPEQKRDEKRAHIVMMAVAAVGLLLMSMTVSQPLWENLPLIKFVQFPWRLIGRAALPIAFLSGAAFANLAGRPKTADHPQEPAQSETTKTRRIIQLVLPALAVALFLLEALPYLYPYYCIDEPYPTILTVQAYEHNTGLVGVDPAGSYFPVTVQQRPQSSPLEADYQNGQTPQRFDASQLPAGAAIDNIDYAPLSADITLSTPTPFEARYLTFAFPGWTASIDGNKVDITPSEPDGLITFPVPAGQHEIQIRWQLTPIRQLMTAVTLFSLIGVLATAVIVTRQNPTLSFVNRFGKSIRELPTRAGLPNHEPSFEKPSRQFPKLRYKAFLITALLLISFKIVVVDRVETPFRRASGPTVDNSANLLANELQFAGYNLTRQTVPSGGTFDIHLAWQVLAQPTANYQSNVLLVGPDGNIWSDKETYRPRIYESTAQTTFWLPNQWAWDSREVQLLPGTPPGQYNIVLTLFNLANLEPITLLEADGSVRGPTAVIGTITVAHPDQPPDFQPQFPLQAETSGLHLLGYNQDRAEAIPGEQLLLTLFWEKAADTAAKENLDLTLLDDSGQPVQSWQIPPVLTTYPPSAWEPNERLRGQHNLRLAASLESGRYQFRLEEIDLGTITINAPERLFELPHSETAVNAPFGQQIELVGYTTQIDANALSVALIWRGLTEIPTSYRIFVHLVDASGQIIAQSDGEPANWSRPTTGWAAGEYILDPHQLTLPAGTDPASLILHVGLYDPTTNTRLLTNAADFISLTP